MLSLCWRDQCLFVCMLSFFFFFFFNSDGEYVLFLIAIKLPGRSLEIAWGCNPLCESVIVVIIIIISWLDDDHWLLGGKKHWIYMHQMVEKNRSAYFFNLDLHRSGWDRWCFICPMSVLPFFFFFCPAWMLITQTAATISRSEPVPDHRFQLWEGPVLPRPFQRENTVSKCKPVAPPGTAGLLRDHGNANSAP